MNIIRSTKYLEDGSSIESELERRGNAVRLRLRLVDAAGFVVAAFRHTERLPREFERDAVIQQAMFDPVEEIWRHRQQVLRG